MSSTIRTTVITHPTRRGSGRRRAGVSALLAAGLVAVLAACSGAPAEPAEAAATAAETVEITDAWVKAVDGGMTGGFALLENTGAVDVTLVSAATGIAGMVELHETVTSDGSGMVMQQKDGGFTIAAGETLDLAPGGNHIMLMGVAQPLQPGDEVVVTLTFSDGSALEHAFTVKEFAGADEEYIGEGGMPDSGDE